MPERQVIQGMARLSHTTQRCDQCVDVIKYKKTTLRIQSSCDTMSSAGMLMMIQWFIKITLVVTLVLLMIFPLRRNFTR